MKTTSRDKLSIVHIIPTLGEGGAERFVVDLCNELSREKSLNISIITLFDVDDNMFISKNRSSSVQHFSLNKKKGLDISVFLKLYKIIRYLSPDIVHTHLNAFDYNWLNLIFNKKIHYFHTLHSDAARECSHKFIRNIRRFFYQRNVTPITISENSSYSYKEIYHLDNDVIIYNGRRTLNKTEHFDEVEKDFVKTFRTTAKTKVFVNIANISSNKNQLELVKAFNKLISENQDIALILIGSPKSVNDEEYLLKIQSILKERIYVLGKKNNIEDYLFSADAFCLSSKMEGMPITIIESFSAGCIPICTPVGGIPNMIENDGYGIVGTGVSMENIYDMIKKFILLSEDEKNQIRVNIQHLFEKRFSISISASNHLSAYNAENE